MDNDLLWIRQIITTRDNFSEDLDFTLLDDSMTDNEIRSFFMDIFIQIREDANIPVEILESNKHEDGGMNFYIGFVGPLGGQGTNKKIKTDISRSENMAFPARRIPALISYSDLPEHELLCYSLEEVLVEKLRSVMQRMQARDYFDLWYLLENHQMDIEFYANEFAQKCIDKSLNPGDFHNKLTARLPQYKARWNKSLGEQIRDLPDFEKVERQVQRHIRKLNI